MAARVLATPLPDPAQGQTTVDNFLKLGNPDQHKSGSFVRSPNEPADLSSPSSPGSAATTKALPSAEPATMKGQAYTLDSSFLLNQPAKTQGNTKAKSQPDGLSPAAVPAGTTPLHFKGSDGRLEVDLPRNSLDLSQATLEDGSAPVGTLSLHIRQNHGHYISANSVLGSYAIEVKDSKSHLVHGIQLRQPLTIRYHYTARELSLLNLNPNNIQLSWPDSIAAAQQAKQPTSPLIVPMTNDAAAHTLSAQLTTLGVGTMDASGPPSVELMPKPLTFSVGGNSGQLAYSYPFQLAPGQGGFAPQLALSYNSQSLNERHSQRAPGNTVGDGWTLSLGSITAQEYNWGDGSTANGTYYFLSGVDGVNERLVPDVTAGMYVTQHISHLRIKKDGDCWRVWDRDGSYAEYGCTSDSQQYTSNADGSKKIYRWDVNKMLAPMATPEYKRVTTVFYLQDQTTDANGHPVIRDAAIKQIRYGYGYPDASNTEMDVVVGSVNFHYWASFSDSIFADPYPQSYKDACVWPNGSKPTLRCDDPLPYQGINTPDVMSTLTLTSLTSYVGWDIQQGQKVAQYDFTYQDAPGASCWLYPLIEQYCAGRHLLTSITPTIFQNGTANMRKGIVFDYTEPQRAYYRDPAHTFPLNPSSQYTVQTWWRYLKSYKDLDTGSSAVVVYEEAFANTHGTPYIKDSSGKVIDDRRNPLYCVHHANDSDTSKRCDGNYQHPEDLFWSTEVVTRLTQMSKDSSDASLDVEQYVYDYSLAVVNDPVATPSGVNWDCHKEPSSNPDVSANPFLAKCVSDVWSPGYDGTPNPAPDSNWVSYYDQEFRGFAAVYITDPVGDLHAQYYLATDGPWTPSHGVANYLSGQLVQDAYYWKDAPDPANMIQETINTYAGQQGGPAICNGALNAVYNPCLVRVLKSRTLRHEGGQDDVTPWVEHQYKYDDYDATGNGVYVGGYGNLLSEKIFGSNLTTDTTQPFLTKTWTYQTTDVDNANGIAGHFYNVNKVSSSQLTDNTGHVWQCQDFTYDEGRPSGLPAPSIGLVTTTTSYSDCANKASTAIKTYTGYDFYGNIVATVDGFGAAHSSIYSTRGCSLTTAPAYLPTSWTSGHYTSCAFYDKNQNKGVLPYQQQNALSQQTSATYDAGQGFLPISATDANAQTTTISYSYTISGDKNTSTVTVQTRLPRETGSFTKQSRAVSTCQNNDDVLPCYVVEESSSLYPNAVKRTYYNRKGEPVETRTPLDATHDLITFTIHNVRERSTFESVPFRYPTGSNWVDPVTAKIDNGTVAPTGTITFYDPLGRVTVVRDPSLGSAAEPGISCPYEDGRWTSCTGYGSFGLPTGVSDPAYNYTYQIDANNHMVVSFKDVLGRERYTQWYSSGQDIEANVTTRRETRYNALDKPIAVIVTDLAPQSGQTITSVTTTATYDDLGRQLTVADPDRGTHTYAYDADSRVITDTSGSRVIGTGYDLLGRVGCIEGGAPRTDGSGACNGNGRQLVRNTYDTSTLGVAGSTDFPIGRQTASVSTSYFPDNTSVTTMQQVQYDQRGRAITATMLLDLPTSWSTTVPTYKKTQAYNDADQPTMTQTFAGTQSGYTFSQAYDSTTGTTIGLSSNGNSVPNLVSLSSNEYGLVAGLQFFANNGNALASETFSYDGNLRPLSATASWLPNSGNSGTIFSNTRVYDPAGNVITVSTTHQQASGVSGSGGSETQDFCYDEQNRLVWAGTTGTIPAAGNGTCGTTPLASTFTGATYTSSYSYTHLGQLWQGPLNGSGSGREYLYCESNHPHQLTGVYPAGTTCANRGSATQLYSTCYDSWGNQACRGYNGAYADIYYDAQDRVSYWDGGNNGQEWYAYDASGQRVAQRTTKGGVTSLTTYAFGLEEHVYNSMGINTANKYYFKLGGRLVGQFDGTTYRYILTDGLGSVLAMFDNLAGTASLVGNQLYGPYGNKRYQAGTMGTNKGYTGQYEDATTGLDYYNARYYDPVVGRFVSADTEEGNGQGLDPYAYVRGNPETANDPSGHRFSCPPDCGTSRDDPNGPPCTAGGVGCSGGPPLPPSSGTQSPPLSCSVTCNPIVTGWTPPTSAPTPTSTPTPSGSQQQGDQQQKGQSSTDNTKNDGCQLTIFGSCVKNSGLFFGGIAMALSGIAVLGAGLWALFQAEGTLSWIFEFFKGAVEKAANAVLLWIHVGMRMIRDAFSSSPKWLNILIDALAIVSDIAALVITNIDIVESIGDKRTKNIFNALGALIRGFDKAQSKGTKDSVYREKTKNLGADFVNEVAGIGALGYDITSLISDINS